MSEKPLTPLGKWRVGTSCPKNLYLQTSDQPTKQDLDVGRMDSERLAAYIVDTLNKAPSEDLMRENEELRTENDALRTHLKQAYQHTTELQTHNEESRATFLATIHNTADFLATISPDFLWWGSAADTVVEHACEADARLHEDNCSTVHRWLTGPWIHDNGEIWGGTPQLIDLHQTTTDLIAARTTIRRIHAAITDPWPMTDPGEDGLSAIMGILRDRSATWVTEPTPEEN